MGAGKEEGEGGLTPTEDDDAASVYFSRRQAYCPLSTEGIVGRKIPMIGLNCSHHSQGGDTLMSFGQNVQFLRRMRNRMTQEALAEKLNVSRQTVSKWELDMAYPEMNKLLELCDLFCCSMDQLVREDICINEEAYSDIRVREVPAFRYIRYAVVSAEPEADAIAHVRSWANALGLTAPEIIGWDFPVVSPEQTNVFHMHGYAAALILPETVRDGDIPGEVVCQRAQKYMVITIRNPAAAPFRLIPNAYKVLMTHMQVNGIRHREDAGVLSCFEQEYDLEGVPYMDVSIAAE